MEAFEESLTRLITGLRTGAPDAADEFWRRYGPILHRLAERKLSPGVRRRLGPEDVAQSACRTFLRRAQGGEFTFGDGDSILRLLCAITLTKVREKTRYHLRQKRSVNSEVMLEEPHGTGEADPGQLAEFNDLLAAVLAGLDEEERAMLELKLLDHTHDEIAERLGCSERTVRRILKRVQTNFEAILDT